MAKWNNNQLKVAREILADLCPNADDARRLIADLGIPAKRFRFDGTATTMWFNLLEELNKLERVDDLIQIAAKEYETSSDLQKLVRPASSAPTTQPTTSPQAPAGAPLEASSELASPTLQANGPVVNAPSAQSSTTWKVAPTAASIFNDLSGEPWRQLQDGLASAFPTYAALQQFMEFRFRENIANITSAQVGLQQQLYDLIQWSTARGSAEALFRAARAERPGNPRLLAFELVVTAPGPQSRPKPIEESSFEQVLRKQVPMLKLDALLRNLGEIGARVCRVEINGSPKGTGFLIGPSCVITNHHVMQRVVLGAVSPDKVTVRFDYRPGHNGAVFSLDRGDWLVHDSKYADFEATDPRGGTPADDELDYTVVRVAGAPGKKPVGSGATPQAPPRGWVRIPEGQVPFEKDAPLFIVQHPQGRSMEIAIETRGVISVNSNRTRLEHGVNTDPGSSGSPVFDLDGNLVALHHAGDPAVIPVYNQAIPIDTIRGHLERENKFADIGN